MAVYQFECLKCHSIIDVSCPISESDTLDPLCFKQGCDGQKTERIISRTSFSLKGGCWAKDGYAK